MRPKDNPVRYGVSDNPAAPLSKNARTFFIYGLRVRSDLPLPLPPITGDFHDLVIRFEGLSLHLAAMSIGGYTRKWRRQKHHWLLRFRADNGHFVEFLYEPDGKHLAIRQSSPEWRNTISILMYTALAVALHLQGVPVLHGSSVVDDDAACLITGDSGAGKSTLAAALVDAGLSFHADDVSALCWESGHPVVQAGCPLLKIQAQVGTVLGWPAATMRPLFPSVPEYSEKWVDTTALPGGFYDRPAPLQAIYLLSGRRSDLCKPHFETLSPGQGCLALVSHLYGRPWLKTQEDSALRLCSQIAATTPIRRLWLPDSLEHLRTTARAVMADMRSADYSSV